MLFTLARVSCPPHKSFDECVLQHCEEVPIRNCFTRPLFPSSSSISASAAAASAATADAPQRRQRNGSSNSNADQQQQADSLSSSTSSSSLLRNKQPCESCVVELCARVDSSGFFFASDLARGYNVAKAANSSSDAVHTLLNAAQERGNVTALGRSIALSQGQRLEHPHASRIHFLIESFDLSSQPTTTTTTTATHSKAAQQQHQQQLSSISVSSAIPLSRVIHVFRTLQGWLNAVPRSNVLPPCDHNKKQSAATTTTVAADDTEKNNSGAAAAAVVDAEYPTTSNKDKKQVEELSDRCAAAAEQIGRWLAVVVAASNSGDASTSESGANNKNKNKKTNLGEAEDAATTKTVQLQRTKLFVLTSASLQNETYLNGKAMPRWVPVPLLPDDVIDVLTPAIVDQVVATTIDDDGNEVVAPSQQLASPQQAQQAQGQHAQEQEPTPSVVTARSKYRSPLPRFVVRCREQSPDRDLPVLGSSEMRKRRSLSMSAASP